MPLGWDESDLKLSRVLTEAEGWVILSLGLILPLLIVPAGYDPFRFPKILAVRCAAIVLVTIALVRFVRIPDWSFARRAWSDSLVAVAGALVAWTTLSCVFSPEPSYSLWALSDTIAGVVVFFSARHYMRSAGRTSLIWLLLIPALANIVVLTLSRAGIWYPLVSIEAFHELPIGDQRLLVKAGLMGNRNDLGMYLLAPLCLAVAGLFERRRWIRRLSSVAVAVIAFGIIMSSTLTAIIVAVLVILSGTSLALILRRNVPLRRALLVIALFVVLLLAAVSVSDVADRIWTVSATAGENLEEASGGRLGVFGTAARMAMERPLFGVGPGRFPIRYFDVATELRESYPEIFPSGSRLWYDMVHNDYLEIAAETGLPGLLLSVVFLFFLLRAGARGIKKDDEDVSWPVALLLLTLSGGLVATVHYPMQLGGVFGSYAILAGFLLGAHEKGC